MGKSVKIKILSIVTCLVLILVTGCGSRGVSEESAEAKSTVPIVTYPVKPMEGEMIQNGMEGNNISDADAEDEDEDEDNTGDRPVKGQSKETAESDQETGTEAVKAESADRTDVGSNISDGGTPDGTETDSSASGAGEGYADGQDDTAVSDVSESISDMEGIEYNEYESESYEEPYYEDNGYIEPLPEPSVPEPEAEEAGETEPSGDGEVLGESLSSLGTWTISFYCSCVECTGSGNGITASGTYAQPWHTAATDGLEFGTMLYVDGLGYFVVEDRGTSYGWLDVFVADHSEALALGLQYRDVYLVG